MGPAWEETIPGDAGEPTSSDVPETPRHGFQGDRRVPSFRAVPGALSITVSREVGSRGATIARRVGRILGWQIYNQELLQYIAQEGTAAQEVFARLTPGAKNWMNQRLDLLLRQQNISRHPSILALARTMLALAAQGEVVLVGRGAGFVLPPESSLHVRIIAPVEDRVAYLAQWLRLTPAEASEQLQTRDKQRAEFLDAHYHRKTADIYPYHMLLNSSLLGEDLSAELIALAVRRRGEALKETLAQKPGRQS